MQTVLFIAKVIGFTLAGLVGLVILFFGAVLVRKSMPYVFAGDIERLAVTAPYNSEAMATEACGHPADLVGSADTESPLLALPKGRIQGWRLLYPLEGTATVRVTGIGYRRVGDQATGPCDALFTFRYRFAWAYNGRATVLDASFTSRPVIVRR